MSRKPVEEKSKEEILLSLNKVGHSKSEWAKALDVTTSAIEGWLKRGRVPKDIWDRLNKWDKSKQVLNTNPKLTEFTNEELINELANRHPGMKVKLLIEP